MRVILKRKERKTWRLDLIPRESKAIEKGTSWVETKRKIYLAIMRSKVLRNRRQNRKV